MSSTRRVLTVLGLTTAVIAGATLPASADFAVTAAVPTTTIATGTVAAPAWVSVNDSCATTTTTTVRRTVYTDPITLVQTQTAYSSTSSTVTSASNVNSYSSTSAAGPGLNETTTTTVTQNTALWVTVSCAATTTARGVTGYLAYAYLVDGSVVPMAQTAATVLTTSGTVDADYLAYQPRLSVTTLTSYGWTAATAQTPVLSC